jgi:putative ABC transport system permease protein
MTFHFGWRVLWRSLSRQRARLSVALLALALGSTLVSSLLNLSGDIGGQVGRELRAYGANLIIRPRGLAPASGGNEPALGTTRPVQALTENDLARVRAIPGVIGFVPYLYTVVTVEQQPVVLTGVDFSAARELNSWWQVEGRWPEAPTEVLAGRQAADALDLTPGRTLAIDYKGETHILHVVGVLESGGAEDEQIVTGLKVVQDLTRQPDRVGLAMASALAATRPLEAIARDVQTALPEADVRTLAQFAQAESNVLGKVRLLIGLVAALVLITAALTVAGTLHTMIIERRAEIGLMQALGAADRQITGLFLAEALSAGALGGAVGYVLGLGLALAIGRDVFAATITPVAWGLPGTLVIALGVTLLASVFPVRQALRVDPVKTLRGES